MRCWRRKNLNQDLQDLRMNRIEENCHLSNQNNMEINELTYKINGCAMKVDNTLGNACLSAKAGLSGGNLPTLFGYRIPKSRFSV